MATHTPVGVIATACVTTIVFTRNLDKLLSVFYILDVNANIFFKEPNLFSTLFIINHQPNHIVLWPQWHLPWEICVPCGVMLQRGSIYINHNQMNVSKCVSSAEQAWR